MGAIKIFKRFRELLDVDWPALADGQFLKRVGDAIVGADAPGVANGQVLNDGDGNPSVDAGERALIGADAVLRIDFGRGEVYASDGTSLFNFDSSDGLRGLCLKANQAPPMGSVPLDAVNPAGWVSVKMSGTPSFLPYYQ